MSRRIQNITPAQFAEFTKTGTALVTFWSPDCHPCRMQTHILEEMAKSPELSAVKFLMLDVHEAPELVTRLAVASVPTLFVFKDGESVQDFIGVQNPDILRNALLN